MEHYYKLPKSFRGGNDEERITNSDNTAEFHRGEKKNINIKGPYVYATKEIDK